MITVALTKGRLFKDIFRQKCLREFLRKENRTV